MAGSRQIPGYQPQGLDLGAVHLEPSLTLRGEASSSLFNPSAGGRGDIAATLAPALLATGQAGQARYLVEGKAALARYARFPGYNSDTWGLRAEVALPVAARLRMAANVGATRVMEPPYEAAGANAADGGVVLVDQVHGGLGGEVDLGKTRLIASFDLARSHYLPAVQASGALLSQGFRDDRVARASTRLEHSLAGGRVLFVEAAYRWIRSPHPAPVPDRSARSGEAVAGLRGELGHLVMVELAAGYQWRDYRSAAYRDYRGLAWRARVEWYATPLVTFALNSRRDIVNSPLPAAAGVVVDAVNLKALYEMRRNLNLTLSGSRAVERYRDLPGTSPTVRSWAAGAEAQYAANRHVVVGLSARYLDRRSASSQLPRQGHAVEGGLWLRYAL